MRRGDQPGGKEAEQQRAGQQPIEFVAERSKRDLPNHWKLSFGGKSDYITRSDRCIVDDDPGCLGPRLGCLRGGVVQGSSCHFGEGGNVIEKGNQSGSHECSVTSLAARVKSGALEGAE